MDNTVGIVPFGSLTSKNIYTVKFDIFDTDKDGFITEEELASVLDKETFDSLDLSSIDKDADQKVTEKEYKLWQQETEIKNITNELKKQVIKDFIGQDKDDILKVMDAIEEFKNLFIERYPTSKAIENMARSYKLELPIKYSEIRHTAFNNTKSAIKERVIDAVIEEVINANRNEDNSFSGLIEEGSFTLSENAKRLLGNELSKEAEKFIKKYDGDELETALYSHLTEFLKQTDRSKLSDAISIWEKNKEEIVDLQDDAAFRKLKEKAKSFLTNALEQGIVLTVGNVSVRTPIAVISALAQYSDIAGLVSAMDTVISQLSNRTKLEQLTGTNSNMTEEYEKLLSVSSTATNIFK